MDHGGHGGMGHDMPGMDSGCSMSMLFNADPTPCVLFESWHVRSRGGLFFTMIAIALLGVAYEYTRLYAARYDCAIKMRALLAVSSNGGRRTPTDDGALGGSRSVARGSAVRAPPGAQFVRSLLYVFNVALSFVLMLIVMSYNYYLISAVLFGAFVGHQLLHRDLELGESDRGMACH